jgi:hypothetical protein
MPPPQVRLSSKQAAGSLEQPGHALTPMYNPQFPFADISATSGSRLVGRSADGGARCSRAQAGGLG